MKYLQPHYIFFHGICYLENCVILEHKPNKHIVVSVNHISNFKSVNNPLGLLLDASLN